MNDNTDLRRLTAALLEGELDAAEQSRLEQLVLGDVSARRCYIETMFLLGKLQRMHAGQDSGVQGQGSGVRGLESGDRGPGTSVPSGWKVENRELSVESFADFPKIPKSLNPQIPVINPQISKSPNLQIPRFSLPSPLSSLPSAWAFSYSVATVFLAVAMLGAWSYSFTHPSAFSTADNNRRATSTSDAAKEPAEFTFVGHVSGLVDCRWSDPTTETYPGAGVTLGRRYALKSGLMEIYYDSGAKVILQGPCEYTVESARGGFLAWGKLTAKVEKGEGRREKGEKRNSRRLLSNTENPKSKIRNPKSSSPLSPLPSPLFTVRTPTALVEDLGTEFGVEVSDRGETASHVFAGKVVMRTEGGREKGEGRESENNQSEIRNPKSEIILSAGQSARVEKDAKSGELKLSSGDKLAVTKSEQEKFVRRLREPPKLLDLLDIVAGGNGTGTHRGSGIDPITGEKVAAVDNARRVGRSNYVPVGWNRFIDGVFVPDGWAGPIAVDSSGRLFGEFPETVGRSWGPLWARAAGGKPQDGAAAKAWMYQISSAERFMPDGRGLLCLHPNVGLTFNLGEIRAAYRGSRPARFRALAGLAEAADAALNAASEAELWVIVDGRTKFRREKITRRDGPVAVDVALEATDRFLTLAVTEGGDGITSDWFVLGDPALSMTSNEKENAEKQPMEQ